MKITPEKLSLFSKAVKLTLSELKHSHPEIKITQVHAESLCKRFNGNWSALNKK